MWGGGITWIGHQVNGLADFLFPPACPVCHGPLVALQSNPDFCNLCSDEICFLPSGRCSCCAVPFNATSSSSHLCTDCLKQRPLFSSVFAAGVYSGSLKLALQKFKYAGAVNLDRPLAKLLLAQIPVDTRHDLIVPVPLHVARLRQRGYNQSLLLAKVLADNLHVFLGQEILQRGIDSPHQQGLNARQRAKNLQGAFFGTCRLDGRTVLLVDDVMTTGATVAACSQILKRLGANDVNVAVIARAPRH